MVEMAETNLDFRTHQCCVAILYLKRLGSQQHKGLRVHRLHHKLPDHRVALVLGTSNKTTSGHPNDFFVRKEWIRLPSYTSSARSIILSSAVTTGLSSIMSPLKCERRS
jgi:vancomycin permeability regulator SanA